jgi:hypothetical protein
MGGWISVNKYTKLEQIRKELIVDERFCVQISD